MREQPAVDHPFSTFAKPAEGSAISRLLSGGPTALLASVALVTGSGCLRRCTRCQRDRAGRDRLDVHDVRLLDRGRASVCRSRSPTRSAAEPDAAQALRADRAACRSRAAPCCRICLDGQDGSRGGRGDARRCRSTARSARWRSSTSSIAGTSKVAAASPPPRSPVARNHQSGRALDVSNYSDAHLGDVAPRAGRTTCRAIRSTSITTRRPTFAAKTSSRSSACGTATTRPTRSARTARTVRRPKRASSKRRPPALPRARPA